MAINHTFTFGRESKRIYLDKSRFLFRRRRHCAGSRGCIYEFWKIANRSNRAGCRRVIRSTRDRRLAGRLAGCTFREQCPAYANMVSNERDGKEDTNEQEEAEEIRSLARTCKVLTSASERTDWFQQSRDFCLPLHEYIPSSCILFTRLSFSIVNYF